MISNPVPEARSKMENKVALLLSPVFTLFLLFFVEVLLPGFVSSFLFVVGIVSVVLSDVFFIGS